jgi:hypothetical protein
MMFVKVVLILHPTNALAARHNMQRNARGCYINTGYNCSSFVQ